MESGCDMPELEGSNDCIQQHIMSSFIFCVASLTTLKFVVDVDPQMLKGEKLYTQNWQPLESQITTNRTLMGKVHKRQGKKTWHSNMSCHHVIINVICHVKMHLFTLCECVAHVIMSFVMSSCRICNGAR